MDWNKIMGWVCAIVVAAVVSFFLWTRDSGAIAATATGKSTPITSLQVTYINPRVVGGTFTSDSAALVFSASPKVKTSRFTIGKTGQVVATGELGDVIEIRAGAAADQGLKASLAVTKIGDILTFPSDGKTILTVCCLHARQG